MSPREALWFVLAAGLPSCLIAWGAGFLVRWAAPRWGLIDRPGARKVHAAPTPLGGGLAVWLGVVLTFAAGHAALAWLRSVEPAGGPLTDFVPAFARPHLDGVWSRAPFLWLLLGAGTVLLLLGLLDDFRGLNWRLRLLVQAAVAGGCAAIPQVRLTLFVDWPWLGALLTAVWIVGLVNSFNMLDNMDALSGGVGVITAGLLAAVLLLGPNPEGAGREPQLFVAGLLIVLAGAVLGFLGHNSPPARLFLGDAGAYFIGFVIAVAALLATYTTYFGGERYAVLAPVCILAVPLYDLTTVVCLRAASGKSPFHADKNHFSHRLVDLGMSKGQAVLTVHLTTATCGLGGLLLHRVRDAAGAAIVLLLVACVLALIAILEFTARRKIHG